MYTEEARKKVRKEMRLFDLADFCWATIFGILLAWLGVSVAERFGAFQGAVIEGWLGTMDLRGMAMLLARVSVFVMTFMVTLYVRKK